ncbi:MAG: chemotaxis protein CheC [Chloroflexi bacterium]|jgi:chemotaxis protein CheC|nr:chemotaxis protein CheC [Chloroflexota bacterium]
MLQQPTKFTNSQLSSWDELITEAAKNSIQALSDMSGQDIKSSLVKPYKIDVTDIPNSLGGADKVAVGVLLGIEQIPSFHIALIHSPKTAYQVVDILMGYESGTTVGLGEMEISALGEMGNIMGGYFLNTIGDKTGYELKPTPPSVRMDMTGAILDYAIASLMMETDEVTMIEAKYGTAEAQVDGVFAVMPSPELQSQIITSWGVK